MSISNPERSEGIEVTTNDNKVNIVLDASMYDVLETCKAKYNYRHNFNKAVPIIHKAKALDKGSMLHEGLDIYYNGLKNGTSFNDRLHLAIKRVQSYASDPDQSNAEPEDIETIITALEQSCDYWRFEDEQMEILEVEQAFAYILYEDAYVRIIITGKIDLLVNIPAIGRASGYNNLPIDHKSFERDSEVLRLANQFLNYSYAVQSHYLVVNRVGLQKTLKPEQKFKRVPLSYDPLMWDEWKADVIHMILNEYLSCIETGVWKRNLTSCFKFNRKCEYYPICETSGVEAKLFKLESDFATISPWDVTAKLNKG